MKIANRNIRLEDLHGKIVPFARVVLGVNTMKQPWKNLRCYLQRKSPTRVEFKNGVQIGLSSNPDDIITVFVVYFHNDYGAIPSGAVVVDVGANIGVFSIYAATHGAGRVYACEPNREAFERLVENVRCNRLEDKVVPLHCAVSDRNGFVGIPKRSSPYNRVVPWSEDADDEALHADYDRVPCQTLDRIVEEAGLETIDFLKLDCEGAEFAILPALSDRTCRRIRDIRLEYHADPSPLVAALDARGFAVEHRRGTHSIGNLWLSRR